MVCPMRIVVAAASVAVLLWLVLASAWERDTAPVDRVLRPSGRPPRSWWRFCASLFTGELLYAYWGGGDGEDASGGAGRDGHDKQE